jgi:Holliday junction DNA helicase RuvA
MISYLKGKFTLKQPAQIIVECNGVGYCVYISLHTFTKIQALTEGLIHCFFHVKEDGQTLWGFFDEMERDIFVHLISVSGIGPNTARMMLSSLTPDEVQRAILSENVALIQSVKGIGPKTAKRAILELKDRIGKVATVGGGANELMPTASASSILRNEAIGALIALGFPKNTSELMVTKVLNTQPDATVEMVIKTALKAM